MDWHKYTQDFPLKEGVSYLLWVKDEPQLTLEDGWAAADCFKGSLYYEHGGRVDMSKVTHVAEIVNPNN